MNVATLRLLTTRNLKDFLRASANAAGVHDVDVDASVALFNRICRETAADRRARGRSIDEIEAPIMLGALDDLALHQAVGKVSVAVRAEAVGREEAAVFVAKECK